MGLPLALRFVPAKRFETQTFAGIARRVEMTRQRQQLTIAPSLLAVTPMMFIAILMTDPHSLAGLIMTWIPFTAPVTVILRLTLDAAGIAATVDEMIRRAGGEVE